MSERIETSAGSLPCDTYECADRMWCIQRHMCKREQQTAPRIFTVYEGYCYWSMPDGSNRCITSEDARLINASIAALRQISKMDEWSPGAAVLARKVLS